MGVFQLREKGTLGKGTVLLLWGMLLPAFGQDGVADLPRAVTEADFEMVKKSSPFLRTLNLSDTYLLRAVVSMGGESLATLYNRNTKETVVVSTASESRNGMRLMGVSKADDLGRVSVEVSVGGEVVELKYDEKSITPVGDGSSIGGGKAKAGKDGRDGKEQPKGPRPEEVKRYKELSPEKREKFHQYIRQTMKKYPDISREEKGNMIRGALIRLSDGQDIEVDEANAIKN